MTDSNAHAAQPVLDYYASIESRPSLPRRFRNIDNADIFTEYLKHLRIAETRNFVLDFGRDDAWCAIDLDDQDIRALLNAQACPQLDPVRCRGSSNWLPIQRPSSLETRWINIWAPELQKDIVKAIATHYDLSVRLQGMLSSDPAKLLIPTPYDVTASSSSEASTDTEKQSAPTSVADLERGHRLNNVSMIKEASLRLDIGKLSFGQVVNEIWHFHSVDWGQGYLCLGYNSVYTVRDVNFPRTENVPSGKRIWTWLILCDDGTVVSIHENPFPHPQHLQQQEQNKALDVIRRTVLNIFSHLSKEHHAAADKNSLMTTQIRQFSRSGQSPDMQKPADGPSLLLYYLFDDWMTSYSLVARKEQQFGVELGELRKKMLYRAEVDLIKELHLIGKRLAILKQIYQSYDLIIDRVLERQRILRSEAWSRAQAVSLPSEGARGDTLLLREQSSIMALTMSEDASLGVRLSSKAIVRFQRLQDRIRLYALSEIDECLSEKDSLVFLNFNLIAMKESQAVEKLTRITILLAKATIIFLPVSLMTGYFSVQIQDLQGVYTVKTYWVTFAVIVGLTLIFLLIFGIASDTVEGKTIYRSLAQSVFYAAKAAIEAARGKRKRKTG